MFKDTVFWIIQVTSLVVLVNNRPFCRFVVSLYCVAVPPQGVTYTVACVQDYVQCPHIMRRKFFSLFRIIVLTAAIASAGDVCNHSHFDPWESARDGPSSEIVADLERCRGVVLFRSKGAKNRSDCIFASEIVETSTINEAIGRAGVRISNVVEVGDVHFKLEELHDPGLPGISPSTPSCCKGRDRIRTSSLLLSSKFFHSRIVPFPLPASGSTWKNVQFLRLL